MLNNYFDQSRCLASLAVFRELYNSKKDIYEIIAEFLLEVIGANSKFQFELTEITKLLNSSFDFNIPEAVVKTSLAKLVFLTKDKGLYFVSNPNNINNPKIDIKQKEIESQNRHIISNIFSFIEEQKGFELNDNDKERVTHSFCSFLLDDSSTNGYSDYISAFILKNSTDIDFKKKINTIKEGVVLYSGIKYNNKINEYISWRNELTIFIGTEVLFHFGGYNGDIYKTIFEDFFSLVKEVNIKNKKKVIKLKYFSEVKDEVGYFFKKAESIVDGKTKLIPGSTAMTEIVNGCKSVADVVLKKTNFFQLLRTNGIIEDDYDDYFSQKNHVYNIINNETLEKESAKSDENQIATKLRFLNYVSIQRGERNKNNFDDIGYILLTGNSQTLKTAWSEDIKEKGDVPLATDLWFLTNKLWFKLNKGFGDGNYPKSFDVITKAQILLSSHLNETVSGQYELLQLQFKEGKLNEEQAVANIIELRKTVKRPEEIDELDAVSILDSINESTIDRYNEEHQKLKNSAKEYKEENVTLKDEVSKSQQELKRYRDAEARRRKMRKLILVIFKGILSIVLTLLFYYLIVEVIGVENKWFVFFLTFVSFIIALLSFFGINYSKVQSYFKNK